MTARLIRALWLSEGLRFLQLFSEITGRPAFAVRCNVAGSVFASSPSSAIEAKEEACGYFKALNAEQIMYYYFF